MRGRREETANEKGDVQKGGVGEWEQARAAETEEEEEEEAESVEHSTLIPAMASSQLAPFEQLANWRPARKEGDSIFKLTNLFLFL